MVRVHLSPPNFPLTLLFRLVKEKLLTNKYFELEDLRNEKFLLIFEFEKTQTEGRRDVWNLTSAICNLESHLENWTKYARQTRDRTMWHPSLKWSQCFKKRVIKTITIFASEINSNRLEDHIKSVNCALRLAIVVRLSKVQGKRGLKRRLRYKGRRANALALRADEGRG